MPARDRPCPLHARHVPGAGGEAVTRELHRGAEDAGERQAPKAGVGVAPRANRAGHGDRKRPAERHDPVPRRPERGGTRARRRATRAVEREQLPPRGVPHEPERVPADAARAGHDDGQHGVRRDRGVDGRAAGPKHAVPGDRRQVVRGNDGPARPASDRHGHRQGRGTGRHGSSSASTAAVSGPPT
jgi:hypothetical protein